MILIWSNQAFNWYSITHWGIFFGMWSWTCCDTCHLTLCCLSVRLKVEPCRSQLNHSMLKGVDVTQNSKAMHQLYTLTAQQYCYCVCLKMNNGMEYKTHPGELLKENSDVMQLKVECFYFICIHLKKRHFKLLGFLESWFFSSSKFAKARPIRLSVTIK